MSAIYGIVGEGSLPLLHSIGKRLFHRGNVVCEWEASPGAYFGWRGFKNSSIEQYSNSFDVVTNANLYNRGEILNLLSPHRIPGVNEFSDQELIQALIDTFGIKGLTFINGDFVIAIWDRNNERLILARDRMGSRTLYYWLGPNCIAFASEYKAFYAMEDFSPSPDIHALQFLQASKYLPLGSTLLKNVRAIPAATFVEFKNNKVTEGERYWEPKFPIHDHTEKPAKDKLLSLFLKSMERRLNSVETLAVALSGGVDSNAVLAAIRRIRPNETIKTFTIGSGEDDPEILAARRSAKLYQAEHFEEILIPDGIQDDIPNWIWHLEDPIGRTEGFLYFRLMQLAARHTDTIFIGAASDGLFAGMPKHKLIKLMQLFPLGKGVLEEFYQYTQVSRPPDSFLGKAIVHLYYGKSELPAPRIIGAETNLQQTTLPRSRDGILTEVLRNGVRSGIPGWMPKVEKSYMAHGIDFRSPFTDNDLVDFSFQLPESFKLRGLKDKYIFRQAILPLIPPEIARTPKFPQRMDYNLRLSEVLDSLADNYLDPGSVKQRGFFDCFEIDALRSRRKEKAYSGNRAMRLWTAIMTEIWSRIFLDSRGDSLYW